MQIINHQELAFPLLIVAALACLGIIKLIEMIADYTLRKEFKDWFKEKGK